MAGTPLHSERGSTPVPDPTLLTTAALTREISALKELVVTRLDAMDKAQSLFETNLTRVPTETEKAISHLKDLHESKFVQIEATSTSRKEGISARLDGMDKAIVLVQTIRDDLPGMMDEKISALQDVHEEKFASIQTQIKERDVRTEQSSKTSKEALDAALQAAEKASLKQTETFTASIAKSEAATGKQIDGLIATVGAGNKATDEKIDDLKERMTQIEGINRGGSLERVDHRSQKDSQTQIWLAVFALITLAALIWGMTRTTPTPVIQYSPTVPVTK